MALFDKHIFTFLYALLKCCLQTITVLELTFLAKKIPFPHYRPFPHYIPCLSIYTTTKKVQLVPHVPFFEGQDTRFEI